MKSYDYTLEINDSHCSSELLDLFFDLTGDDSIVFSNRDTISLSVHVETNNIIKEVSRVVGALRKAGWQCNYCEIGTQ